ncbi:YjjG family noncanonical pyrimidine nucleotidase [Maribacter sp. 2-571]|uniref:YjjG family noncanonical pyrimidine nucleotidase n=1 Tax=Maribacter sp. 2-571 TaxID=3417569 RepID=UPI003D343147
MRIINKHIVTDIFFDLDHTLWDFEKNSALTFKTIFEKHAIGVDLDVFLTAYVPANLVYWRRYRENQITKEALRYERLKSVFDAIAHPVDDPTIDLLSEAYIAGLSRQKHLFPNTIEVLDYLKPNYRLHIITNGFEEIQERKLRNSGIDGYFEQVVNSEMAGVKKPHPDIFKMGMELAGTKPENSIMIGDSLEADIAGAIGFGLQAIHFNSDNGPLHETCVTIKELNEIKTYL